MRLFRYFILGILLLNLPAASLKFVSASLGTVLSYGSFLLLIVYYIFEKKGKLNLWMISLGLSYYLISAFQYYGNERLIIIIFIKYFIIVVCGYEAIKRITKQELFFFLLFGALSILMHTLFFRSDYGRYSGFYINPNVAGFICISGYGLTYGLKNKKLKLIGQFVFTLMGLLTFSRTFIALWLLLNVISILISIKNIRIFFIGFLILITLFSIDEFVGLNNPRFQQLKAIVGNEQVSSSEISQGSRTETWARFYDYVLQKPIFGNGYGSFQGSGLERLGSHNTYLLVIGEAGIIPFILFIGLFFYFLSSSVKLFKISPNLLMQSIAISIFLMANHNFFNFYYITLQAMWIQYQISTLEEEINET